MPQGVFSVGGTDPTVNMPANGSNSDNFWMDLQIDTNPPSGASYRLWPSYPVLPGGVSYDTTGYTLAPEFRLSAPALWTRSGSTRPLRRGRAADTVRHLEHKLAERSCQHR